MRQDLSPSEKGIDFTNDSIVVRKFINGVEGGRMLDCSNFPFSSIMAGHCVITDGNGNYKPMPVSGEMYGAMPEGYKYVGVVYRSAKVKEPVSIMTRGVVNKYRVPYPFKSDFTLADIIIGCDLEEYDPYEKYETITDPSELVNKEGSDIRVASDEVVNAFTAAMPYYKNILATNVEVDESITMKAEEKITLDNIALAGGQGATNGKIIYAASELELRNITAKENTTLYNAFEGYQSTTDPKYTGLKKLVAENLNIDCPSLTHNIINVYTPANNAEIIVRNSKFNLTVDKSNILRMANYMNSENVTITFENVDWTYENGLSFNDWYWAGLVIYQPASSDKALIGNVSALATWKLKFKNCRYNGQKVTANNFGQHNQVFYLYNVNNTRLVSDPAAVEGLTIEFE